MTRLAPLSVLAVLPLVAAAAGDDLPADARRLIDQHQSDISAIRKRADDDVRDRTAATVDGLVALQDAYTRAGKLDEAVAVREAVRRLRSTLPQAAARPVTAGRAADGRRVLVTTAGRTWPAEVAEERDGEFLVRRIGAADDDAQWVPKTDVRFLAVQGHAVGQPAPIAQPGLAANPAEFLPPVRGPEAVGWQVDILWGNSW